MKKPIYPVLMLFVFSLSAFTIVESVNWKVKEDLYSINFTGTKVEGIFKGLKATIVFDEANLGESKIAATIDASSANTGNGMKNQHVSDALEAERYPTIKFESSSISKKGTSYEAVGKLTIKDVTKEITLPFTFENKGNEGTFTGKFSVTPKYYNVSRGGTPETVDIVLTVPVSK